MTCVMLFKRNYPEKAAKVKFYIGDVRGRASIDIAMRGGVDYISQPLPKAVPSCEFFPLQAVYTMLGTGNVIESAIAMG